MPLTFPEACALLPDMSDTIRLRDIGFSPLASTLNTLVWTEFEDIFDSNIQNQNFNHAKGFLEVLSPESLKELLGKVLKCYLSHFYRLEVSTDGWNGQFRVKLPFIPGDSLAFNTHAVEDGFNRLMNWFLDNLSGHVPPLTRELRVGISRVFSYLTYVIEEALPPASYKSMFSMNWEPLVLFEGNGEDLTKKAILLLLPNLPKEVGKLHIAVPSGLLHRRFAHLHRVWILTEKRGSGDSSWELLAKTKMLWEADVFCSHLSRMTPRSQQKVYGSRGYRALEDLRFGIPRCYLACMRSPYLVFHFGECGSK